MGFRLENLDKWSSELEFKVTNEQIQKYSAATNNVAAEHLDGALAPPMFAVVPQSLAAAQGQAGEIEYPVIDLEPAEAMKVLHGEQDVYFHEPIRPGMELRIKSATVGIFGKSSGTTAVIKFETTDADNAPVNTQYWTLFYRGVSPTESRGEAAPPRSVVDENYRQRDPLATVAQQFDDDQTRRYAEASGDHMAIHLDDDLAKSVGLPGVIVHGLCTMAFASRAVIDSVGGRDPNALKRLAVRFSRVALPGEQIDTHIWDAGHIFDRNIYAFETVNSGGETILTNGLAEIAR